MKAALRVIRSPTRHLFLLGGLRAAFSFHRFAASLHVTVGEAVALPALERQSSV
jgi:hypothetical protein